MKINVSEYLSLFLNLILNILIKIFALKKMMNNIKCHFVGDIFLYHLLETKISIWFLLNNVQLIKKSKNFRFYVSYFKYVALKRFI